MKKVFPIAGTILLAALCSSGCVGGSSALPLDPPSNAKVVIVTNSLPTAALAQSYQAQLQASGGTGVYQWSAKGLPPGLVLDGSGLLHGSPTSIGSYNSSIKVQTVKLAGYPGYGEALAVIRIRPIRFARRAAQATAQVTLTLTITAHWVDLSWTEAQSSIPAVGFNCYRSTTAQGPWMQINAVPVAVMTFRDNNVTSGSTYWYYVTAISSSGAESPPSNIASGKVP